MYFGLSEDQIMLQDSVRRFLEAQSELEHVRVYAEGDDALAGQLQNGLMELGVPLVLIPEAQVQFPAELFPSHLILQPICFQARNTEA